MPRHRVAAGEQQREDAITDGRNERKKRPTVAAEDMPELTDDQVARMRPAEEVVPEIVRAYRGKQKKPTKKLVAIRLDEDLIDKLKEDGRGWQTRANDALRKAMRLPRNAASGQFTPARKKDEKSMAVKAGKSGSRVATSKR